MNRYAAQLHERNVAQINGKRSVIGKGKNETLTREWNDVIELPSWDIFLSTNGLYRMLENAMQIMKKKLRFLPR